MLRHGFKQSYAAPHTQRRAVFSRHLQLPIHASAAPLDRVASPSPNGSSTSDGTSSVIPRISSLSSSPSRPYIPQRHVGVLAQADRLDLDEVWVPFRWPGQFGGDEVYISGTSVLLYACIAAPAWSIEQYQD